MILKRALGSEEASVGSESRPRGHGGRAYILPGDSVDTPTGSSSDSALATSLWVSREFGNPE
jgi:hypothetical protein